MTSPNEPAGEAPFNPQYAAPAVAAPDAVPSGRVVLINLVPLRRLEAKQTRTWRNRCVAACGAYALAVAGVSVSARLLADHGASGGHEADAATRLGEANDQLGRSGEAVNREQASLAEAESLLTASRAMVDQPDWSRLMGLLAAKAQGEVMLKGCGIRPREAPAADGGAPKPPPRGQKAPAADPAILVSLSGLAPTQSAASQYALRLEGTGLFGRVALTDTSRDAFQGLAVVAFRIECTLADPNAVKAAPMVAAVAPRVQPKRAVAGGGEP